MHLTHTTVMLKCTSLTVFVLSIVVLALVTDSLRVDFFRLRTRLAYTYASSDVTLGVHACAHPCDCLPV